MTIAELHSKLNPDRPDGAHERMEDLLTSDVFGTMKYSGWQYGFIDWLRLAENPYSKIAASTVLPDKSTIRRILFVFWPTLDNNREPDLLLGIETTNNELIQVMIEAKYLSGASDSSAPADENNTSYTGNQIADQINCFPKKFPDNSCRSIQSIHLYVTAHDTCPVHIYDSARKHIVRKDVPMFWLNWQSLTPLLSDLQIEDAGRSEMINDLRQLLVKKRLFPFDGFKTSIENTWSNSIGQSYWQERLWNIIAPPIPNTGGFWGG